MPKYQLRGYITGETLELAQQMAVAESRDIELDITSVGGSFFTATAIAGILRDAGKSVRMHVQGLAASAASYLLTGASYVSADQDAMIMLHNARLTVFDSLTEEQAESIAEMLERANDILVDAYARRIRSMTREAIAEKMKSDWWLSASEAKELGLVDEVRTATTPGLQNVYALTASIVNNFGSNALTSIFCDVPTPTQTQATMKDLNKVLAAVGASSEEALLDAVNNVIRERDTLQTQLAGKAEIVTTLTSKQAELEQTLATLRAELDESRVNATVDEIVANAKVIVSDEVRAAIARRVSNATKITDEAIKADMLADAAIYAKMNGAAADAPAGSPPSRKPNVAGASYEERLQAKMNELINTGVSLDEAYAQARKLVKDKEA